MYDPTLDMSRTAPLPPHLAEHKINADIICLQETKANVEETKIALSVFNEYNIYANSSKARKGYSGTAILTKIKPLNVIYDIDIEIHDQEGRVLLMEFEKFNLINVYVPNGNPIEINLFTMVSVGDL